MIENTHLKCNFYQIDIKDRMLRMGDLISRIIFFPRNILELNIFIFGLRKGGQVQFCYYMRNLLLQQIKILLRINFLNIKDAIYLSPPNKIIILTFFFGMLRSNFLTI